MVGLVDHHEHVVWHPFDQTVHHLATEMGPGRVVRVAHEERLRVGPDRRRQGVGVMAEIGVERHLYRFAAGELGRDAVHDERWPGVDHRAAATDCAGQTEQQFGAARPDHDALGGDAEVLSTAHSVRRNLSLSGYRLTPPAAAAMAALHLGEGRLGVLVRRQLGDLGETQLPGDLVFGLARRVGDDLADLGTDPHHRLVSVARPVDWLPSAVCRPPSAVCRPPSARRATGPPTASAPRRPR